MERIKIVLFCIWFITQIYAEVNADINGEVNAEDDAATPLKRFPRFLDYLGDEICTEDEMTDTIQAHFPMPQTTLLMDCANAVSTKIRAQVLSFCNKPMIEAIRSHAYVAVLDDSFEEYQKKCLHDLYNAAAEYDSDSVGCDETRLRNFLSVDALDYFEVYNESEVHRCVRSLCENYPAFEFSNCEFGVMRLIEMKAEEKNSQIALDRYKRRCMTMIKERSLQFSLNGIYCDNDLLVAFLGDTYKQYFPESYSVALNILYEVPVDFEINDVELIHKFMAIEPKLIELTFDIKLAPEFRVCMKLLWRSELVLFDQYYFSLSSGSSSDGDDADGEVDTDDDDNDDDNDDDVDDADDDGDEGPDLK